MSCGYVKSINLFVGKDCTLHLINIRKTRYSILWTRIDKKTNSYLLTIGVLNKALRPFIKGTIDMWWIWNIETVLKAQNLDLKEKRFIIQETTNRNHLRISQSSYLLEYFSSNFSALLDTHKQKEFTWKFHWEVIQQRYTFDIKNKTK